MEESGELADVVAKAAADLALEYCLGKPLELQLGPAVRGDRSQRFVRIRGLPLELELRMAKAMIKRFPEGNGWSNILVLPDHPGSRGCSRYSIDGRRLSEAEVPHAVAAYYFALPNGPGQRVPARFAALVRSGGVDPWLTKLMAEDFFAPATDLDR